MGNVKLYLFFFYFNKCEVNTVVNNIEQKAYNQIGYRNIQSSCKQQYHASNTSFSEATAKKEKPHISVLGKLRKQTGYSLSLCKKALVNCNQDVEQAKLWLEVIQLIFAKLRFS